MSRTGEQASTPRAVIHKRILDAAESKPSASMEEVAGGIGGASTDLVERVLDRYGDPGGEPGGPGDDHDAAVDPDGRDEVGSRGGADGRTGTDGEIGSTGIDGEIGSTGTDGENGRSESDGTDTDTHEHGNEAGAAAQDGSNGEPRMKENGRADADHPDLSEGQLRALRLIERTPDATQGEIAEEFDVTRATISRWLSDIPGFEWSRRGDLAPRILNGEPIGTAEEGTATGDSRVDGSGPDGPVAHESGVDGSGTDEPGTGDGDPEPFAAFDRRLERVERRLDRLDTGAAAGTETDGNTGTPGIGPDLAHKVVHACLRSDLLSEEEELRLLRELMS